MTEVKDGDVLIHLEELRRVLPGMTGLAADAQMTVHAELCELYVRGNVALGWLSLARPDGSEQKYACLKGSTVERVERAPGAGTEVLVEDVQVLGNRYRRCYLCLVLRGAVPVRDVSEGLPEGVVAWDDADGVVYVERRSDGTLDRP